VPQDNEDDEEVSEEGGWEGGRSDNYYPDAFGVHFEQSSSWAEPTRGRIGYADAGWEVGSGMMEAASGFVDLYHSALSLSLLFIVESVHSDAFGVEEAGGGNDAERIGEGKGHSAAYTGEHTMSLAHARRLTWDAYLSA
jgi:hypothetical protein